MREETIEMYLSQWDPAKVYANPPKEYANPSGELRNQLPAKMYLLVSKSGSSNEVKRNLSVSTS
ncbi:hypothetical protein NKDENANG_02832 [Candidatus Entotheonellaceae bacterium PAL068K]